jgi:thiosulfate/3-mercaptopyruvate sulfurtransferase
LRSIYAEKGVDGSKDTVVCCPMGERSAHTWFVLTQLLGYDNVRNYDGAWSEWGSLLGVLGFAK